MSKDEFLKFLGENKELVFGGLGLTVGSAIVAVIKYFRSEKSKNAPGNVQQVGGFGGVAISGNASIGGNVIGGSYVVNESKSDNSVDELCALLQQRAAVINSTLQQNFKYVRVTKYLSDFNRLHEEHIGALKTKISFWRTRYCYRFTRYHSIFRVPNSGNRTEESVLTFYIVCYPMRSEMVHWSSCIWIRRTLTSTL